MSFTSELQSQDEIQLSQIIKRKPGLDVGSQSHRYAVLRQLCRYLGAKASDQDLAPALSAFHAPELFRSYLTDLLQMSSADIKVTGTIESRVVFLKLPGEVALLATFSSDGTFELPLGVSSRLSVTDEKSALRRCRVSLDFWRYISRPRLYLAALYHPEVFPLPRFSLSISDLARSARKNAVTSLRMTDMQLGNTVEQLANDILTFKPDVLGVSATFGQHDVLSDLVSKLGDDFSGDATLVFGGSLCVLNKEELLKRWPHAFVATGPGEPTIEGLIGWKRGELERESIPGVAFNDLSGRITVTRHPSNRLLDDMVPELDLLDETFRKRGIVQLESSRGCSYACSFCPREHKGIWTGDDPVALQIALPDIERVLEEHPYIAKKVFLVDEEFVGYRRDEEALGRALSVAKQLSSRGFKFETSSRADQVFRRQKNPDWHSQRVDFWRELKRKGLDRCLFGIESGVDSILTRFNKKTTSQQNAAAIRMLSMMGIPPRYTYITFDPLMTREELIASYRFQGRTDLLLDEQPEWSGRQIYEAAIDPNHTSSQAARPFYEEISYMLVSMECLVGAPYTSQARNQGLLGALNPNLGRFDCEYADPDIGLFSSVSQRWIDRNFSLDYLLKSVEKYSSREIRKIIRSLRRLLKHKCYELLGMMLEIWENDGTFIHSDASIKLREQISCISADWPFSTYEQKTNYLINILNSHFADLADSLTSSFATISVQLPEFESIRISREIEDWANRQDWRLINGIDNC
ncbi:B12-binding domain-containing radical SAM protein [Agrobacterium pusense]|jgi:hypothetical protein|uniref:B12-binding domain-containing radical SAM protein n=1 Tax=Agrobacterium pusense TaxID=648995 RepID=UPI00245291C5|nr:radical SAM protein [Agrobacterium pusense]